MIKKLPLICPEHMLYGEYMTWIPVIESATCVGGLLSMDYLFFFLTKGNCIIGEHGSSTICEHIHCLCFGRLISRLFKGRIPFIFVERLHWTPPWLNLH